MNEWVRDDVDGLLFERHDAAGLASRIQRLLDEPGLLDRLRSNAPPVKTLEEYASESADIYASLAKRPSRTASA